MRTVKSIASWITARKSRPPRARSLVLSVICDAIAPHGGKVTLGSLVETGKLMGVSEQTIRSSVNRLVTEDWLISETEGRKSIFCLSNTGAIRASPILHRVYKDNRGEWAGQWSVLIVNHKILEGHIYKQASKDMLWAGFCQISDNVFMRPHRNGNADLCCIGILLAKKSVCVTGSPTQCVKNGPIEEIIRGSWEQNVIAERYTTFNERYVRLLDILSRNLPSKSSEAFALRTFMIHDLRRIRIIDPQLPEPLLPKGWEGFRAFALAREIYQLLLPLSEHYVNEFMQGPAGSLPPADKSLNLRFGPDFPIKSIEIHPEHG